MKAFGDKFGQFAMQVNANIEFEVIYHLDLVSNFDSRELRRRS